MAWVLMAVQALHTKHPFRTASVRLACKCCVEERPNSIAFPLASICAVVMMIDAAHEAFMLCAARAPRPLALFFVLRF